jgi:hypothetical protein
MRFTYLRIPSWKIMLGLSAFLAIVFSFLYWKSDPTSSPKLSALFAGFASAFLVAFFQLFSSILDAIKLSNYEKLGVEGILGNGRRGKDNYEPHISKANKVILVMGVTASRFMSDFGQSTDKNNELTLALARGVTAKFLLPKKEHIRDVDKEKVKETTLPTYNNLKKQYGDKISLKFFDHIAAHSIVVADNTCISGPVFEGVESKDTPAVILKSDSDFAKTYIDNFNREWKLADESFE